MKNEDLIKKLQSLPMDMDVCIFDAVKSSADASDEPSSEGVYKNFNVYVTHTYEELQELQDEFPDTKNFIALEIDPS